MWSDGSGHKEQSVAFYLPREMELVLLVNSPVTSSDTFLYKLVADAYTSNIVELQLNLAKNSIRGLTMKSLIAGAIGGMCPCLITLGKVFTRIRPGWRANRTQLGGALHSAGADLRLRKER
jgi:hypothetical protein